MQIFDSTYTEDMYPYRNEWPEGVFDHRTKKKYPTTLTALLDCQHFDDLELYTGFQVKQSVPDKSLEELYKDRMRALRSKYDYLELSWGGGHDSTMILKVSEQTGCPLDVISMQCFGDPREDDSRFNSEISKNLHHVLSYVEKFPQTKIVFLDINETYKATVEHYLDNKMWCRMTTMGMLDDICRISADRFIPQRNNKNGAVLTGQGWKPVLYNKHYGTWSLYQQQDMVNQLGSISFLVPTIRFYETAEIMIKVGDDIRKKYKTSDQDYLDRADVSQNANVWIGNNEWIHEEIMYTELKGEIFHDGKDPKFHIPWQDEPRFEWFCKNQNAKTMYKEYFEWVEFLDKNIHPSCMLEGGILKGGLKNVKPMMIDF